MGALGDQGGGLAPVVEGLRRGYQDRARYLGDPDFVDMPLERLLSPEYAVERARGIDLNRATPSISLGEPLWARGEKIFLRVLHEENIEKLLTLVHDRKGKIHSIVPRTETLEDIFVEIVKQG